MTGKESNLVQIARSSPSLMVPGRSSQKCVRDLKCFTNEIKHRVTEMLIKGIIYKGVGTGKSTMSGNNLGVSNSKPEVAM